MIRWLLLYLPAVFFILLCIWLAVDPAPLAWAKLHIQSMGLLGYVSYVAVLSVAVIFAPVTVMPIIPIASSVFGAFVTALLSIIGWTVGASGAFYVARFLARPILEKIINVNKIDRFVDSFPKKTHFWSIVLLRMTLPVDVVSYALGLTKSLDFKTYFYATLVGVSYFSFAFAYMGEAFFAGQFYLLLEIGLASLVVFALGWYLLKRSK